MSEPKHAPAQEPPPLPVLPPLPIEAIQPVPRVSDRACPVCPGLLLETWSPGNSVDLHIDRCRRCAGVLFDADEVEQLRRERSRSVLAWLRPPAYELPRPCPSCSAPLAREAEACAVCGRDNHIDCPSCGTQMAVVEVEGRRVDRCRSCRAVWLDASELSLVWMGLAAVVGHQLAVAGADTLTAASTSAASTSAADASAAGGDLIEIAGGAAEALASVDPWLLELVVRAVAEATPAVLRGGGALFEGAVRHAPALAGSAVEGLGQLAGAIVEALAQILGAVADL